MSPQKKTFVIVAVLGLATSGVLAGSKAPAPEKDLDFWVGDWTVVNTTPGANNQSASNRIERMYGGKVIHESFKMGTFEGESWSVYNAKGKTWHQTWVDNQGTYIAMAGGKRGETVVIQTIKRPDAPLVANRMIFSDIKRDSFKWRWEATRDGGKTWTLGMRLEYKRKAVSSD